MLKKGSFFIIAALFFSINGCATGQKKMDLEMQGLRNQVSALEMQLQEKETEIANLKEALVRAEEAKVQTNFVPANIRESTPRPKVKEIQTALKNVGYNPGVIDGKMGRQTKDAIKAFQKANGLAADGKVGKETWKLLKKSLTEKSK